MNQTNPLPYVAAFFIFIAILGLIYVLITLIKVHVRNRPLNDHQKEAIAKACQEWFMREMNKHAGYPPAARNMSQTFIFGIYGGVMRVLTPNQATYEIGYNHSDTSKNNMSDIIRHLYQNAGYQEILKRFPTFTIIIQRHPCQLIVEIDGQKPEILYRSK